MNLAPTDEQRRLAAGAARFLAAELPVATIGDRAAVGNGAGPGAAWHEMAELGWFAVGVPADHGGAGGTLPDQALLFRELGRGLAPGPLLGTVLGTSVAVVAGRDDLAATLMAGTTTAAVAEPWRDPSAAVSASDGVRGRFRVLDAGPSSLLTVVTPVAACVVTTDAARATAQSQATIRALPAPDPSVPVSLAQLSGLPAEAVVDSAEHAAAISARGHLLAAALLVGILEAVRDLSVAYVSTREQFGRPIGSFQAVKHRCADMAVRAEAAGSLLWLAALSLETAQPDVGRRGDKASDARPSITSPGDRSTALRLAASAKALASEYAVASAHDNVQNHGGMGFTAECSAHWYVKRALEWSVTLGAPEILLAEVAR